MKKVFALVLLLCLTALVALPAQAATALSMEELIKILNEPGGNKSGGLPGYLEGRVGKKRAAATLDALKPNASISGGGSSGGGTSKCASCPRGSSSCAADSSATSTTSTVPPKISIARLSGARSSGATDARLKGFGASALPLGAFLGAGGVNFFSSFFFGRTGGASSPVQTRRSAQPASSAKMRSTIPR